MRGLVSGGMSFGRVFRATSSRFLKGCCLFLRLEGFGVQGFTFRMCAAEILKTKAPVDLGFLSGFCEGFFGPLLEECPPSPKLWS